MKKVSLITDGSCLGNPGPGGWACLLTFGGVKKEFFGFDAHTTNNRMELMAPIQGLLALKEPCVVEITTDSQYVLHGITKWVAKWKRRQWWRKHLPVRNVDLWMELDELVSLHKTTGCGPEAMPVTRTTADAIGWPKRRRPPRVAAGRTVGRMLPFVSAWAPITCRRNRSQGCSQMSRRR